MIKFYGKELINSNICTFTLAKLERGWISLIWRWISQALKKISNDETKKFPLK
jgi:hypothetical protein